MSERMPRVDELLREEISAHIGRSLSDPRLGFVTVTSVSTSPDLRHAKVFVSVLVGDAEACLEGLNQAAGFLRNGLFKRLHIHTVPTLHFLYDRTPERAADMNALIARAVASRAKETDAP